MGIAKVIERFTPQTAVYWGNPRNTGYKTEYDDPVEIKCRWEEKFQLVRDDKGDEVVSKAEVLVRKDFDIGGYLMLGETVNLPSDTSTPEEVTGAYQIVNLSKIPFVGSTEIFVRKVYL